MSYQIERYTGEGKLDLLVRRSLSPRRVDRGHIDAFRSERLASLEEPRRSIEARLLAELPFPETFPPHGQIRVDAEGFIWVQDYLIPGQEESRWTVFTPTGRLFGTLPFPRNFQVFEIGVDYVLGLNRDDDDVETVDLYRLQRSR